MYRFLHTTRKPPDESRGLGNFGCDRLRRAGTRSQSAINAL
ncbi:hypothetical protein [Nostoc sp.]